MRLPKLKQNSTTRQSIDEFRGYNHNLRINYNEFYDMKNLTSSNYPTLSPRKKRGVLTDVTAPLGMVSKDSLGYISGGEFHLNQKATVGLRLPLDADISRSEIVSMGAYVIIIARDADGNILDKKWVNSKDLADFGGIDAEYDATLQEGGKVMVNFAMSKVDGELYGDYVASDKEPAATNGALWIDTSSTPHVLKQYSETSKIWVQVLTTYIRIEAVGIGVPFNQYDGVKISGITNESLSDLNNTMVIWDKGDDYIVVIGIIDNVVSEEMPIKVERSMPLMDFVTESENRLWGCRYGLALNGEWVNEIYCSKLGDFKNWNCFMGTSTDSYAASVGTDGQFTGAITHLGYPIFFKEGYMHKIYGNFPSNYQVQTTACRGVQKGSHKSLAIVNETLFYKARASVCSYDGSLPSEISYALGELSYSDAVACAHGNKYYISMKDVFDEYHLFVFDAAKGFWHKEDNTQVDAFCSNRGELYFIERGKDQIQTMLGSGTVDAAPVEWMAETGLIGTDTPDKKYVSRINVRMSLAVGTRVSVYLQYDSGGAWERVLAMNGVNLRSFVMPIRPRRCDHLRMRIVGTGDANIYSIVKTIEEGSDSR